MNKELLCAMEKMNHVIDSLDNIGENYTMKILGRDTVVKGSPIQYDDKSVSIDRVVQDRDELINIVSEFYYNSYERDDLNSFVTLFAMYCNIYIGYGFGNRLGDNGIKIKNVIDKINNEKLKEYIDLIWKGIYHDKIKFMIKATEIFKDFEIPYLYIFIKSSKQVYQFNNRDMEYYISNSYERLSEDLRNHVIGEKLIETTNLGGVVKSILPYIMLIDSPIFSFIETTEDTCDKSLRKSNVIIDRFSYLGIPTLISKDIDSQGFSDVFYKQVELGNLNRELNETKERLEKESKEKKAIVQEFSHTYGNMKATGLYEIAQTLIKTTDLEYKKLARRLLLEYGNKQDLTKDVYMMKLKFEKNFSELQQLIRYSKKKNDIIVEYVDIYGIISSALKRCLMRIFYDGGDLEAGIIRKELKALVQSLNALRDSFEEEVIFNEYDCMRWFEKNIHKFNTNISEEWEKICLLRNSYGEVFLTSIFTELFINLLKYADKLKPIYLQLGISEESRDYLQIVQRNTPISNITSISGVGLSSKNEVLKLVNMEDGKAVRDYMQISNTTEEFSIRIMLRLNLFV